MTIRYLLIDSRKIPVTMGMSHRENDVHGRPLEIIQMNIFYQCFEDKIAIKVINPRVLLPSFRSFAKEKGSCITLAESIFTDMKQFLINYYKYKGLNHLSKLKQETNFNKIDFMTARNILSEAILQKDDDVKGCSTFSSKTKIKAFTKLSHEFISRRNILTHGKIYYYPETEKFIIEHIDNETSIQKYCYLDNEFLIEFKNAFEIIASGMRELNKFLNDLKKNKP